MTEKLGQEPAFPMAFKESFEAQLNSTQQPWGMSKRFYAACAAMQGILAANPKDTWGNINMPVPSYVAELSYIFADELLKQENL